ncbi:MAG: flagellar biosynthesis protein FlhA [Candidatus Krumholzibacteriota bacterium]|nr:flagellar biosynthesis protein FlhA [Candidatus Krumholzibacteriota bacterium]
MADTGVGQRFDRILSGNANALVGVALIGILSVMVLLLPPGFLDLLLSFNITFALIILMVTFYVKDPLHFNVFPTLLLFLTLFRLALNVASTRLILLQGYAGKVIDAFGDFVVGGNAVVGMVVFLILVVIQFVVITKGAGRIAEVAARFTLDAMPGKQMAIDADLNAGLIDEREAKTRRERISEEADFFGAMDGASKFVRGDAIAGIIITVINILGGFIIGVAQRGLSFGEALQTYTLLTVGDGLVSQVPALIISVSAGVVVTRGRSEQELGQDFITQIFGHSKALAIAAAALFLMGLMPGLPNVPFLLLGAMTGAAAFHLRGRDRKQAASDAEAEEAAAPPGDPLADPSIFQVDRLELEIGYGLIPLADAKRRGNLMERVTGVRRQMAGELGLYVSPVRIRDNINLKPNEYAIKLKGVDLERGEILPGHRLCIAPAEERAGLPGIETEEPAFGLPALWVPEAEVEAATSRGLTLVEPAAVISTHLSELVRRHADEVMSREDVKHLVDGVKQMAPALVSELVPAKVPLGFLQAVLANLLHERVPVRDLVTIIETAGDAAEHSNSTDYVAEKVREALGRAIVRELLDERGSLAVLTVDHEVEQLFMDALQQYGETGGIFLAPEAADRFNARLQGEVERVAQRGHQPVLLVASPIRLVFKRYTESLIPGLAVLAFGEVPVGTEVSALGMVTLKDRD